MLEDIRPQPDQTKAEQDPRNESVIHALHAVTARRQQQTQELSQAEIEQSIANIRNRFQASLKQADQPKSSLRLISNTTSGFAPRARRRTSIARYIAIAAVIVLLIASSLVVSNMFLAEKKQTAGHDQVTPQATATQALPPKERAQALVQQLDKEVTTWGTVHPYKNPYDQKTYQLDYSYQQLVKRLQALEQIAKTDKDYTYIADKAQQGLEFHNSFEQAAQGNNAPHVTELKLLSTLKLNGKTVIVFSLANQTARVYTNGVVVRSFPIASSFTKLPTIPGNFQVDMKFDQRGLSSDALPSGQGQIQSSYELDYGTIKQALPFFATYRGFIYCNPQRTVFGPDSQLPHAENGKPADGSITAGIEVPQNDAQWLFEHSQKGSEIVVY
ncbi:L,D-transpeptidase [Ktedonospora formicarum]|uniref:Uncharacterized protein n=1 Tax=Ktedonospora formicarum TaxID=2778364 RepID=A0A8J3MSJ2_9CHLR|nr:L,D-transpeptidase [Ktedonospora formicarum]GHO46180.1 hypothetical protein KSX_43430 [Ktedonospora formicarum]